MQNIPTVHTTHQSARASRCAKILPMFFLYLWSLALPAGAQSLEWGEQIGGTPLVCSSDFIPAAITTDNSGNMLLAGNYPCTADLNPGAAVVNLTTSVSSAFIQKLSPSGTYIWAKGLGAAGSGFAITSITTDAAGNVYVTGYFNGNPDFDPGTAVYTYYSYPEYRMYVLKLNAAGVFQWVKIIGDPSGFTGGYSIKLDVAGSIYVGGMFSGDVDFNPDTASTAVNMLHAYDYNICLLKLSASGDFRWAHGIGDTGTENYVNLEVDAMGGVYYTASFNGSMSPDPAGGPLFTSTGSMETIVSKFDTAGNYIWARQLQAVNSSSWVRPRHMSIDPTGHIAITGAFEGEIDFDPSATSLPITASYPWSSFTARFDANGDLSWAKAVQAGEGYGVGSDSAGNVYTVGEYIRDNTDLDPGAGTFLVHSSHSITSPASCAFVQCLDSTGTFKWGIGTEGTSTILPAVARVTGKGTLFYAGKFYGSADVDPGPDTTLLVNGNGYSYVYALKIAPPIPILVPCISAADKTFIFPNPTEKSINVQSTSAILQLTVTDMTGRVIFRSQPGTTATTVEVNQSGLYLIQVATEKSVVTQKVVVER